MVKADFHNHLRPLRKHSKEYLLKALELSSERLGKNAILSVTNSSDKRYEKMVESPGPERYFLNNKAVTYFPSYQVFLVKSQEVPTKQGHLLVLGLENGYSMKEGKTLEYSLEEAKDKDSIIIAPHPFFVSKIGDYLEQNPSLLSNFDAIEIFNSEVAFFGPSKANEKAKKFYLEHKKSFHLGALSNSDSHSFYEIGSGWTEIDLPRKTNFLSDLKEYIRNTTQETKMHGQTTFTGTLEHILRIVFLKPILNRLSTSEQSPETSPQENAPSSTYRL